MTMEIALLCEAALRMTREHALAALLESEGLACYFPLGELPHVAYERVVPLVKSDGRIPTHLRGLEIEGYVWKLWLIGSVWTLELIRRPEDPPPFTEEEDVIIYKKKSKTCTLF